ncbi:MAG: glycerol-3-phosphate 1-O-acyltransferase PlsY [Steroidobacteraceae bacterium]
MLELGLKTLIAYLLGSLMGALLVGRLRGVDIRELGSGNAGGTNALRTQGPWFAAATLVIDIGKGWVAAGWLPEFGLPGMTADTGVDRDWLASACAAAVVAGHVWPLFHEFRGGKGGATFIGALAALAPLTVAVAVALWLVVATLTGFAGLATMIAAAAMPVAIWLLDPGATALLAFSFAMAVLIAWAHRGNIARLRAGAEPRLGRLGRSRPRRPAS